jgi:hypothetical protein
MSRTFGAAASVMTLVAVALFAFAFSSALPSPTTVYAGEPTKDPCRDDKGEEICPFFISFDTRINPHDAAQTITGYCRQDHSLDVLEVNEGRGSFIFNASLQTIFNSLKSARAKNKAVLINQKNGRQFWALETGELRLFDARPTANYQYTFAGAACGGFNPASLGPAKPLSAKGAQSAPNPAGQGSSTLPVRLTIYTQPDGSVVLATVPRQTRLTLLGRSRDSLWVKVSYGRLVGWLAANLSGLTPAALQALPELQR